MSCAAWACLTSVAVGLSSTAVPFGHFCAWPVAGRPLDDEHRPRSRELGTGGLATVVPLVMVIVGLAIYPQFVLGRTEADTVARLAPAQELATGELTAGVGIR
jgi:hypothetical protein